MYETITQVAKKTVYPHIHLDIMIKKDYYLLLSRAPDGSRLFSEADYEWLSVLQC